MSGRLLRSDDRVTLGEVDVRTSLQCGNRTVRLIGRVSHNDPDSEVWNALDKVYAGF